MATKEGDDERGFGVPLLRGEEGYSSSSCAKGTASVWQTFFNVIVSIVGTGVLGLSFALKIAGWLYGSLAVVVAGLSTFYCMTLLVECRKRVHEEGFVEIASYGDLGALAFGKTGRYATEILVFVSQCGGSVAYLVFIGQNLSNLFNRGTPSFFILCLMPFEIALSFVRSLASLAPFSAIADLYNVLAMAIVVRHDLQLLHGFPELAATTTMSAIPFALGVAVFCFEGFCMTLPLEASMATPSRFRSCLGGAFAGITLVYVSFGFFGYAAYGEDTMDIVTLNLPAGWTSDAVKLGLCVALAFTFPVMMYPIHEIVLQAKVRMGFGRVQAGSGWESAITRGLTVVGVAAMAMLVPGFGSFVSLVGSTVCALLSFVLPAALHLRLVGPVSGTAWRALDGFILAFGVAFAGYGTVSSFTRKG